MRCRVAHIVGKVVTVATPKNYALCKSFGANLVFDVDNPRWVQHMSHRRRTMRTWPSWSSTLSSWLVKPNPTKIGEGSLNVDGARYIRRERMAVKRSSTALHSAGVGCGIDSSWRLQSCLNGGEGSVRIH